MKNCIFMSIVALTTSVFGDVDKAIYGSDGDGPYNYYKSHFYVDDSLCITIGNRIGVKKISNDFHGRPAYSNYYNEVCFADFKCWNWSHGPDFPNLPSQYSPWDREFLMYTVTDFHYDKEKDNGVTNIVSQFLGWKGVDGAYVYPFDRVSDSSDTFTADFYDRTYVPNGGGVSRLPDNVAASSSCDKIVYVGDHPTITAVVNVGFLVNREGDGYVAIPETKSISAAIWIRQVQGELVDSRVDKPYYIRKSLGSKTVNSSELDLSGFYLPNHVPVTFTYELPDDLPPGSYEYYIEFNQRRREMEESYYNNNLTGSFQVRYRSFQLKLEPIDADHANNRLQLRWYIDDPALSKAASADYLINTCEYNFKVWHSGDYDERYDDFCRASLVDSVHYDTMTVDRYFGHKNYGAYPCRYWLSCYDPKTADDDDKNNPITFVDTRHRFGLVVGVSAYDPTEPTLNKPHKDYVVPLESCRKDAKKFADYLKNTPKVGEVVELYDDNATMDVVSRELRNLPDTCGLMPGDIVFLWMSGHGISKYGGVVLYDGRYVTSTNTIPATITTKYAQTFQNDIAWTKNYPGVEVVGILPICHAEQFCYDYATYSNIVWICASKTNEEAVSYSDTSQFTQCFLDNGLIGHNACRDKLDGKPLKESILTQQTISSDIKYKHLSLLKLTRYAHNLAFGDSKNAPAQVAYYGYNAYTVLDSVDMDEWQETSAADHVAAGLIAETNDKDGTITLTLHMEDNAPVEFLTSLLWFKRKTLVNNPNSDTWHWLRTGAISPGDFVNDPNWPGKSRKISFGTGSVLEKKHCGTIYSHETYDFALQFVDKNGFGACAYATGRTGILASANGNGSDDSSGGSDDGGESGNDSGSSDDSEESGEITENIQYGPYVPGEAVAGVFPDGASWKVTGLPTGLKWDAKLPGVTGVPTKPGTNMVYFTWTDKTVTPNVEHKESSTFIVGPLPKVTVMVVGETNGCKVTGGGAYLANKSVTLKATAAAAKKATGKTAAQIATVFAGWYETGAFETNASTCVSLAPSYAMTTPAKDVTLYAKFIALTDDVAAVSFELPDEMTNGVTKVNAAVDVSDCSSLPTVKISGLPTGLKFTDKLVTSKVTTGTGKNKVTTLVTNALPYTIYGTPTKSGVYTVVATVTTAGKKTASYSQAVVVRKSGENVVKAEVVLIDAIGAIASTEAVPGKVTGTGIYSAGKKVTLKATANKGFVFAGWYPVDAIVSIASKEEKTSVSDAMETIASTCVSRLVTYTIDKMPANDVELVAAFITSECDKSNIVATVNGMAFGEPVEGTRDACPYFATNIWAGVYLEWPVAARALSQTTVKVAGLPSGLKFTDKPVTTKTTSGSGKTKITTITTNVSANTIYGAPSAASKAGKPSVVKLTVTTAGKSSQTYQINTTVDPLPVWAQGSFEGGWEKTDAATEGGLVSLAVSSAGKVSGKALGDGLTYTLTAPYYSSVDVSAAQSESTPYQNAVTSFLADVTVNWNYKSGTKTTKTNETVQVFVRDNGIGGYAGTHNWFEAYLTNWKIEPWKSLGKKFDKDTLTYVIKSDGTFSESADDLALSLGEDIKGKVTLKFSASGKVTVAGEFVSGYDTKKKKYVTVKATGSSTLIPQDEEQGLVFVYLTPKGLATHARCLEIPWPAD